MRPLQPSPGQLTLLDPETYLPEGFRYRAELMTRAEEQDLLVRFSDLPFQPYDFHGYLGKRRVVSFGLSYDFGEMKLRETAPLPDWLSPLRERAAGFAGLAPEAIAHVLVTEYEPGAPIGWHRDRPVFDDVIGVSLASPCRFRFRRRNDHIGARSNLLRSAGMAGEVARRGTDWKRTEVMLAPRSVYLLRGPARTEWEHSIPPGEALRYSVTFRTLKTA